MPAVRAKSSRAIAIAPDCEISDRRSGQRVHRANGRVETSEVRTIPKLAVQERAPATPERARPARAASVGRRWDHRSAHP